MSQKAIVKTLEVPVNQIKPSPYQPRLTFDLEDIKGSIQRDGILVPLTVRKKEEYYELIDGERRLRLAKELAYKSVPCTVIDVNDETARRMVWKVNTLRKDYTPKETACYFRWLQKTYGFSLRGIATECGRDDETVRMYLNVFKLPEEQQEYVWLGKVGIGHIKLLSSLLNGAEASAPAVTDWVERIVTEEISEDRLKILLYPTLEKIREKQLEAAKKAVPKVEPEVKAPETPEELENAAVTLRKEAKKKREEALTPKEKAEQERIKEEKKRRSEETKKRHEEEQTKRIEQEVKKRASGFEEIERRRIEEEARKKAKEELFKDRTVLKEAAVRYSEVKRTEREEARSRLEQAVLPIELTEADLVHKVIIGDAKDVLRSVPASSIDMVVTSPPYFGLKEYEDELGINTENLKHYLDDLKDIFTECFRVLKDGRFICIVIGQYTSEENSHFIPAHVAHILEEIGFNYKREHIWVKPLGIQGIWNRGTTSFLQKPYPRNTMINIHHEHILIYQKGDKPTIFYGRNPLTEEEVKQYCWSVWELPVSDIKDHPAPYPEVIPFRLIKMYSYEGEVVLDPFLGSGTTVKVAKKLKRRSIGIEVSPEYLDVIKRSIGGADFLYHDGQKKLDFSYLTATIPSKIQ